MSKPKAPETPRPFRLPGQFIETTFRREYKAQIKATDEQANAAFEAALKSGEVVPAKSWGGIQIYEFSVPLK